MAKPRDPSPKAAATLPEAVYQKSLDCVHCGLCLSSCPTYLATGRETSSPRGRIYLMRGVAEGRIPLGDTVAEEAFLCVGCRACETACPSGVEFGAMLELTRDAVDAAGLRDGPARTLERLVLRGVVPRRWRLKALVGLLGLAQRLRLDRALLPLLPRSLAEAHAYMPAIPAARERRALPEITPARGERRGRVAFFVGCVMPELFGEINRATVRVLARNGYEVVVPRSQGCCGALQAHAGDLDFARGLARKNLEAFGGLEIDALVSNSAGCGTALREAEAWLPGEAEAFSAGVRDVAEFLDEVGLRAPDGLSAEAEGSSPLRVCYDDPCHLVHSQGVSAQPRRLLEAIPGIELIQHADPTRCCGAAGIYNLTHAEMSHEILESKMDSLVDANPDVIATGNPGCLLQIRRGAAERGLAAEVVHPIELLDRAYRDESEGPAS